MFYSHFLIRVDILFLCSFVIFEMDKTFFEMLHNVSKLQKTKSYLEEGWVIANYLFIMRDVLDEGEGSCEGHQTWCCFPASIAPGLYL